MEMDEQRLSQSIHVWTCTRLKNLKNSSDIRSTRLVNTIRSQTQTPAFTVGLVKNLPRQQKIDISSNKFIGLYGAGERTSDTERCKMLWKIVSAAFFWCGVTSDDVTPFCTPFSLLPTLVTTKRFVFLFTLSRGVFFLIVPVDLLSMTLW